MVKSSTGRWKPLFKFSKVSAVVPVSCGDEEGSKGKTSPVPRGSGNGSRLLMKGQTNSGSSKSAVQPHAWVPGPVVLNGSGRPGSVFTDEDVAAPVLQCPWEVKRLSIPQMLRGILAPTSFPSARSVGKGVKFRDALVTAFIDPPWSSAEIKDIDSQMRSSTRKATGGVVQEPPEEAPDDEASDGSSGFGSDDEEDELDAMEKLAEKNARLNKEATKLKKPCPIGPRLGNVPRTPTAPPGLVLPIPLRGEDAFGVGLGATSPPKSYLVNAPPRRSSVDEERSSFASSSDEEAVPAPVKVAVPVSGPQLFTAFVEVSKLPAKPVADDDASSFGSSSDGDA